MLELVTQWNKVWTIRQCARASLPNETVAKVNSLTILQARLSRLCRKDEAQGAEGEV